MKRVLHVSPQADRDLDLLAEYIARTSRRAALRFYDAVAVSYRRLIESPEIAATYDMGHPLLQDLRAWPVRGFPNHLIFYRVTQAAVEVVRILHGARDVVGAFRE
ncbi:MAG: type II toxin-antitoxin system RelE/ParE family toxin [Planctomycetia bacterium]|nr:type II toxin-antitoxin system RelE/ParE family toxin [Planctomycetia bacterium]